MDATPADKVEIWYRHFHDTTVYLGYVEVQRGAHVSYLRRALCAVGFKDPMNPGNNLGINDIQIWRLNDENSIPRKDEDAWKSMVDDPGTELRKIAVELITGTIEQFHREDSFLILSWRTVPVRLWFRYFGCPDDPPSFVVVPKGATLPELHRALAACKLKDPTSLNRFLEESEIRLWQPVNLVRISKSDDAKWRKALDGCGNIIDNMAVEVTFGTVDDFQCRDSTQGNDDLTLIVSRRVWTSLRATASRRQANEEEGQISSLIHFYSGRTACDYLPCSVVASMLLAGYQDLIRHQSSWRSETSFPIYDGRHPADAQPTLAMPVSLYHPVFENWRNWAFDQTFEPPAEVILASAKFMQHASVLHDSESDRMEMLCGLLQDAICHGIGTVSNHDLTTADGRTTIGIEWNGTTHKVPVLIQEELGEFSDASIQTSSMLQAWIESDLDDFRDLACCPTFLLCFSGCYLIVCGAVLTDKCIVNRLAMIWVGHSSTHDEAATRDIARIFCALSRAIVALKAWYTAIIEAQRPIFTPSLPSHPRFFPFATCYPSIGEDFSTNLVNFRYIAPLQKSATCVTFLAETQAVDTDNKRIVVKFAQRYCPEVHRVLASQSMAPNLLYCGRIDASTPYRGWKLVVMEFFNGEPSYNHNRHRRPDVKDTVTKMVKAAHEAGFVLGDVRPPNILVKKGDEMKMIDFDWAGKDGDTRYPAYMSTGLWVKGVSPTVFIKREHDMDMIDKWFSPDSPPA